MRPQSISTFKIEKGSLIFSHLCVVKKVWVNFKRKVLYFRSSNHTAGEIRPATKSDIEVKTVSVTSVVKFKGTEVTCCRFLDTFMWPFDLRTYFVCKNPVLGCILRHLSIVLLYNWLFLKQNSWEMSYRARPRTRFLDTKAVLYKSKSLRNNKKDK